MARSATSPKYSLPTVLPKVGSLLKALSQEGQKKPPCGIPYRRLLQELPGDADERGAMLAGVLAVLRGMGLIHIDRHGGVRCISRYACYVLGSLGKFLEASVPAAYEGVNAREQKYLSNLTRALESVRVENPQVDDQPIHSRRIVSVLVKSRQIRHWRAQDVYLHIYHLQWREYHLVGLSHKDGSKTDEQIAEMALRRKVRLMPDQYSLDTTFRIEGVTDTRISATSGALTKYTYCLMAVKRVQVKLQLKKLIEQEEEFGQDSFRWFTWEEMKSRQSEQREPIMLSPATLMTQEELAAIPIEAASADDVRYPVDDLNVLRYLSYRVTRRKLLFCTGFLFILALVIQLLYCEVASLGQGSLLLEILGNIADVLSFFLALGAALSGGASIALRRKS